jgi:FdhE protein
VRERAVRPPSPGRGEAREITELRALKRVQPDLGDAVDLQIALLELQRRVQGRVHTPWVNVDPDWLRRQQEAGQPLLRFNDIPLDWTDFRLMFRESAELLRRHDSLDHADYQSIQALTREAHALEPLALEWYNRTAVRQQAPPESGALAAVPEMINQVFLLAMRPFLARCADVLLPRLDLSAWRWGYCPLCGGEPDFATITPSADRLLICGRCTGRWRYDSLACPFCENADRGSITSFASRDGHYRLYACDVCRRYIKAYDGRQASRPVMVPVDSVATLPLDAAAIQKGYAG